MRTTLEKPIYQKGHWNWTYITIGILMILIGIALIIGLPSSGSSVDITAQGIHYKNPCTELQPHQEAAIKRWEGTIRQHSMHTQSYSTDELIQFAGGNIDDASELGLVMQLIREINGGVICYAASEPVAKLLQSLVNEAVKP